MMCLPSSRCCRHGMDPHPECGMEAAIQVLCLSGENFHQIIGINSNLEIVCLPVT